MRSTSQAVNRYGLSKGGVHFFVDPRSIQSLRRSTVTQKRTTVFNFIVGSLPTTPRRHTAKPECHHPPPPRQPPDRLPRHLARPRSIRHRPPTPGATEPPRVHLRLAVDRTVLLTSTSMRFTWWCTAIVSSPCLFTCGLPANRRCTLVGYHIMHDGVKLA